MLIKIEEIKNNYVSAIDELREEHTKFLHKINDITYEKNLKESAKYKDWIGKYFAIIDSMTNIPKTYGKILQIRFSNFMTGDFQFPYFEDRLYIDYEREPLKESKTLTINLNSCGRCQDQIIISDDLESLKLLRECSK